MLVTSNLPISPSQILIQSHISFTRSNINYLLLQYYDNSIFLTTLTQNFTELNLKLVIEFENDEGDNGMLVKWSVNASLDLIVILLESGKLITVNLDDLIAFSNNQTVLNSLELEKLKSYNIINKLSNSKSFYHLDNTLILPTFSRDLEIINMHSNASRLLNFGLTPNYMNLSCSELLSDLIIGRLPTTEQNNIMQNRNNSGGQEGIILVSTKEHHLVALYRDYCVRLAVINTQVKYLNVVKIEEVEYLIIMDNSGSIKLLTLINLLSLTEFNLRDKVIKVEVIDKCNYLLLMKNGKVKLITITQIDDSLKIEDISYKLSSNPICNSNFITNIVALNKFNIKNNSNSSKFIIEFSYGELNLLEINPNNYENGIDDNDSLICLSSKLNDIMNTLKLSNLTNKSLNNTLFQLQQTNKVYQSLLINPSCIDFNFNLNCLGSEKFFVEVVMTTNQVELNEGWFLGCQFSIEEDSGKDTIENYLESINLPLSTNNINCEGNQEWHLAIPLPTNRLFNLSSILLQFQLIWKLEKSSFTPQLTGINPLPVCYQKKINLLEFGQFEIINEVPQTLSKYGKFEFSINEENLEIKLRTTEGRGYYSWKLNLYKILIQINSETSSIQVYYSNYFTNNLNQSDKILVERRLKACIVDWIENF